MKRKKQKDRKPRINLLTDDANALQHISVVLPGGVKVKIRDLLTEEIIAQRKRWQETRPYKPKQRDPKKRVLKKIASENISRAKTALTCVRNSVDSNGKDILNSILNNVK